MNEAGEEEIFSPALPIGVAKRTALSHRPTLLVGGAQPDIELSPPNKSLLPGASFRFLPAKKANKQNWDESQKLSVLPPMRERFRMEGK